MDLDALAREMAEHIDREWYGARQGAGWIASKLRQVQDDERSRSAGICNRLAARLPSACAEQLRRAARWIHKGGSGE